MRAFFDEDFESKKVYHERRRASHEDIKIQLNPPVLGGLTEVDPSTSLPSGVPESRCLPCLTILLRLSGGHALSWTTKESSADQDGGCT